MKNITPKKPYVEKRLPRLKVEQISNSDLKMVYISVIHQAAKEFTGVDIPFAMKQCYSKRGYTNEEILIIFRDKAKAFFMSEDFELMASILDLDYFAIRSEVEKGILNVNTSRRKALTADYRTNSNYVKKGEKKDKRRKHHPKWNNKKKSKAKNNNPEKAYKPI